MGRRLQFQRAGQLSLGFGAFLHVPESLADGGVQLGGHFRVIGKLGVNRLGEIIQHLTHRVVGALGGLRIGGAQHLLQEGCHPIGGGGLAIGALLFAHRLLLGPRRPDHLPTADQHAGQENHDDGRRRPKADFVPPNRLLKLIQPARWPGHHRLQVQVTLQVRRQTVGRLVAPRPVLLQRLHHNPVQIPLQLL